MPRIDLAHGMHACPGNVYFVDEFGTLQPHHANEYNRAERKFNASNVKCPQCNKIKVIYPQSSSAKHKCDLKSVPSSTLRADTLNIHAFLKGNRAPYEPESPKSHSTSKNNFKLTSYFK